MAHPTRHSWSPRVKPKMQRLPWQLDQRDDSACPEIPSFARSSPANRSPPGNWPRSISAAFQKDRCQTEVESCRNLQSQNIEFTMKRLRAPIEGVGG
jgi:hypothetical protein